MTFRALFEHSSIGIIISNREGNIVKSNVFANKIFGYEANELNGLMVEVLIPKPLKEKHIEDRRQFNKNPTSRAMGENLNLWAVKKNGEKIAVEISLSHYEEDGQLQIVTFINEITERRMAEERLQKLAKELEAKAAERTRELTDALQELHHTNVGLEKEMEHRKKYETQILKTLEREKELNELKSRFVSMASHEFRTPLSGILTSASLLARYNQVGDEHKRERHIQIIKKSVKNLTNILNDFLSLDKLEQGKITSHASSFTLSKFMQTLVEDFRDLSENAQRIVLVPSKVDATLFQDKEMLQNVMNNLISNAIKYSPEKSLITIRTSLENKAVTIEIEDQGIGIPQEDQKHLFERFFRANNVTTVQGTGLGLNIVKRYLDLMGGCISFISKENQGTTFKITLPLEMPV